MSDVLRRAEMTVVHESDRVLGEIEYPDQFGVHQRVMGWIAGACQRSGVRTCPHFAEALASYHVRCLIVLPLGLAMCDRCSDALMPLIAASALAPLPRCDWCGLDVEQVGDMEELTMRRFNLAVTGLCCDGCHLLADELLEDRRV